MSIHGAPALFDPATLQAAAGPRWTVRLAAVVGSTNTDLIAAGPPDRSVLVADAQTAGRGRLGRSWSAPPGTALLFSVALRVPQVPPARRGWIGALLGVALVSALQADGVPAGLKWPNDVLVDEAKIAGILAESAGDLLVVGAGVNVSVDRGDLPRVDATSLHLLGAPVDRARLLGAVLTALDGLLLPWLARAGEVIGTELEVDYLGRLTTVGRRVRLELPGDRRIVGTATGVEPDGSLRVTADDGQVGSYAAADVVHLRSESG